MRNKRKAASLLGNPRPEKQPRVESKITSNISENLHAKFESEEEEMPSPVQQATATDAQSDPLTSLPFEATQNVFAFLSPRELASAQLVSQNWNQLVERHKKESPHWDREFPEDSSFQKSRAKVDSYNAKMDLEEEEPKKATTIAVVDKELLDHTFTFLPSKEFMNARKVCSHWNNIIDTPQSWQKRIRNDFPYLEKTQNEQFNQNPKALYIEGYKQYQIWKDIFKTELENNKITGKEFRAALNGEVPAVETTSIIKYETLCAIAIANGHHQFKTSLPREDIYYAAAIGNLSTVKHLIKEKYFEKDSFFYSMGNIYNSPAIKYKHFEIIKYLIEMAKIINNTLDYKYVLQNLFYNAASKGHLEFLDYIWDHFPEFDPTDNIALTRAIKGALTRNHPDIAKHIIQKAPNPLSSIQREQIITIAAEKGQFEIMKSLQQDNSQDKPQQTKRCLVM